MALIKCPECNKEISDKAKVCIHCGYPISEIIEQQNHNNGFFKIRLINCFNKKPNAIMHVRAITGLDIKKAKALVDLNQPVIISGLTYDDANAIKKIFNNDDIEISIEEDNESTNRTIINIKDDNPKVQNYTQPQQPLQPQPQNQVHCPYCNSTNVNKISSTKKAASIIGLGILSNKIGKQWHCNCCKSDF
ncbi:ribosomal protein L7/L12 [Faecalicatena contorta]|uniref:ribosomal protein L7/L12 n=1 Tax=Faecalicatena contorta TaxID=39482 RepID=UPI001F226F12|nr:ribosomal protein L7/L12 [Faecalicatena contorta]MCF2554418.1 ribosomal protein L7/L12 [Faecalicatena contorta]